MYQCQRHIFFSILTRSMSFLTRKHGNRQADGGGQFSHTGSLTDNIRYG